MDTPTDSLAVPQAPATSSDSQPAHIMLAEVLQQARDLIATHGWTRGAHALDASGLPVPATSASAARFGLDAALIRAIHLHAPASFHVAWMAADVMAAALGQPVAPRRMLLDYNDAPKRCAHEVLDALDAAIHIARSRA